jgi:hypothetical protein
VAGHLVECLVGWLRGKEFRSCGGFGYNCMYLRNCTRITTPVCSRGIEDLALRACMRRMNYYRPFQAVDEQATG